MNSETLLHRQIHPDFIIKEEVSSQAFDVASSVFVPTKHDNKQLSVYNGEKFTPKESFDHFTKDFSSYGVLSVSKKDCDNIEMEVVEDNNPFDGHSYIDYSRCETNGKIKKQAKKLKRIALERGWSYISEK